MLLLLPNNSLQEDPNDLPADTPAVIEAKDKRSVDAILDPEDLRPINGMLDELYPKKLKNIMLHE